MIMVTVPTLTVVMPPYTALAVLVVAAVQIVVIIAVAVMVMAPVVVMVPMPVRERWGRGHGKYKSCHSQSDENQSLLHCSSPERSISENATCNIGEINLLACKQCI